jgi:hypothetical protein
VNTVTLVYISAVELDGERSEGYYVDDGGVLRRVPLGEGEAIAIEKALTDGSDAVGYDLGDEN